MITLFIVEEKFIAPIISLNSQDLNPLQLRPVKRGRGDAAQRKRWYLQLSGEGFESENLQDSAAFTFEPKIC